ncbi:MAG: hypothetical protein QXJ19_04070 [Candidatus Bathyarchaeia archaeon]|nr:hypothetical protein [Candidatus Bathyarchaeota archaeon]
MVQNIDLISPRLFDVTCNQIIAEEIRRIVEQHGLSFFTHELISLIDGGLCFG